ncbi:MAG: hypothetical protein K2X66_14795 [Cyanobacteria bacterium]|nr:hypothetical protein [Cyanobacteriota bacterium]
MTLQKWLDEKRIKPHQTTAEEINSLYKLVERDLTDAEVPGLSADMRYTITYNAALQLATIVLYASGYRTSKMGHHWVTFQLLTELLGQHAKEQADYFDNCRTKRNAAEYVQAGAISEAEVKELLEEVYAFNENVSLWLKQHHSNLLP